MSSLRERMIAARPGPGVAVTALDERLPLEKLARTSGLGPARATLAGRSLLLRTSTQLGAVHGLVELDGLAGRLVLCPPDVADVHLPAIIAAAEVEGIVTDAPAAVEAHGLPVHTLGALEAPVVSDGPSVTDWLLFTSGTAGAPKMVVHSLAGLTGAIPPPVPPATRPAWGTFYDIRRYGGLQALLRALHGGCSMALCDYAEPVKEQVQRLARLQVSHLTGTPSHWRRLLMSAYATSIAPAYVRLSGEIADQPLLDALTATYPKARIVHAYASTEAGVGFEIEDRLEGFPDDLIGAPGPVQLKVEDGSLRLRSPRMATRYVGADAPPLADADGFIDSGDMVERSGGRWRFVGRRSGVINVGGLKVHPEEIEAVINRHPAVRMSRVLGRRNPILGAVVCAEIALSDPSAATSQEDDAALRASILNMCRQALPPHKAPAVIRFVSGIEMTASGKLERTRD